MIVCHCQNITDRDIHAAIGWMRAADPRSIITPGRIYHALGKSADCGGCISHFVAVMRSDPDIGVPQELRTLRASQASQPKEKAHER
ncbi:bacterioferritin-associated ferredoxin [Maritimibacter sp. HL-12]|uniref:(2Fe-2S)-binding protein n=1 Tax=Maritimibacter sp. HL-12 TaxID=1162418 RepID=UPI000A0EFCE0|nr:(2Fe-2S)-binding protein [Maritimibacter sp. HL-12]SMH57527.1 Bacterioferritin-associated ferredoxin [Maritimibacter sp. HL-12]